MSCKRNNSTSCGNIVLNGKPPSDALRKFSGQEIVQQDTEIGTLITVVLEQPSKPEGTEVKLSVLLPLVTLGIVGEKNTVQADVKSIAILTTQKVGILLQPVGQSQTYEFLPLTGTASFQGS